MTLLCRKTIYFFEMACEILNAQPISIYDSNCNPRGICLSIFYEHSLDLIIAFIMDCDGDDGGGPCVRYCHSLHETNLCYWCLKTNALVPLMSVLAFAKDVYCMTPELNLSVSQDFMNICYSEESWHDELIRILNELISQNKTYSTPVMTRLNITEAMKILFTTYRPPSKQNDSAIDIGGNLSLGCLEDLCDNENMIPNDTFDFNDLLPPPDEQLWNNLMVNSELNSTNSPHACSLDLCSNQNEADRVILHCKGGNHDVCACCLEVAIKSHIMTLEQYQQDNVLQYVPMFRCPYPNCRALLPPKFLYGLAHKINDEGCKQRITSLIYDMSTMHSDVYKKIQKS